MRMASWVAVLLGTLSTSALAQDRLWKEMGTDPMVIEPDFSLEEEENSLLEPEQPMDFMPGFAFGLGGGAIRDQALDEWSWIAYLTVQFRLIPFLSIVGNIGLNYEEDDVTIGGTPIGKLERYIWPVMAMARLFPMGEMVFVEGGVAWWFVSHVFRNTAGAVVTDTTDSTFALGIGPGLQIPIGPFGSFEASVKWWFLEATDVSTGTTRIDSADDVLMITAGLVFGF